MTSKFSLVGVGISLVVFLAVGLLPSLLYGGYAGLLLAGGITGSNEPTIFVRSMVVFGMVLGVTAIAALFTVVGAAVGAAVGALLSVGSRKRVVA